MLEKATITPTPARDIVLLCNPRAGGHWRELAKILDSEEARFARRIVTDTVDDIEPALGQIGGADLLCIYGGDGTIQRIIDRIYHSVTARRPQLAFIGGGTMNLAARWCGHRASPAQNFRTIVRAHRDGSLLLRDVSLLRVRQRSAVHYGFTFGAGPIVRLVDAYERGVRGRLAAASLASRALLAAATHRPRDLAALLHNMSATVDIDGVRLPYDGFVALFCSVTGEINPLVRAFVEPRERGRFHTLAYAVTARELALVLPLVSRGVLPIDARALLQPMSTWRRVTAPYGRHGASMPNDPRYVNRNACEVELHSDEPIYTIDGEVLRSSGDAINVGLGPRLSVVVSSTVDLGLTLRLAASSAAGAARHSRRARRA